jgi:hypothetical protein
MDADINQLIEQYRQIARSAEEQARQLTVLSEFASRLSTYISDEWWQHAIKLIDEQNQTLSANHVPTIDRAQLNRTREYALEKAKLESRRYPKLFEEACQQANIPLDNSPHPRYTTDNYFIKISIDETNQVAKIENHESELATLPMDIAAVIHTLIQERQRLFERPFEPQEFIERLYQDYNAILSVEKLANGDPVRIRSITKRRGKNIKGFRVDEFSVDLWRLSQHGITTTQNGYQLRFEQTKNINQGMLLPSGQGYIGFIRFSKSS